MNSISLLPGAVPLAGWRAIYNGAAISLDPGCRPAVQAAADLVAAIVAKGEPVYGINTGFGKLATVRIDAADLATLQRNIVLSHSAGVGQPTSAAVMRLMMALKLASLAQGASGVRLEVIGLVRRTGGLQVRSNVMMGHLTDRHVVVPPIRLQTRYPRRIQFQWNLPAPARASAHAAQAHELFPLSCFVSTYRLSGIETRSQ